MIIPLTLVQVSWVPLSNTCHCERNAAISGEVGWFRLYEPRFRREIAIRQRRTRNDKSDFEKALVRV